MINQIDDALLQNDQFSRSEQELNTKNQNYINYFEQYNVSI